MQAARTACAAMIPLTLLMCIPSVRCTGKPVWLIFGSSNGGKDMKRNEVLDFVRECETSFMATVENGMPRVRAMDTPHVDDSGLTFCTGSTKDVCLQLTADPSVELCYWNGEKGLQLRIRGRMERVSDLALLKHIVNTRFTFLIPVVERFGWDALALFRLSKGEVRAWSPENLSGVTSEVFEF